ncbi:hypothetical protein [Psychroflexus sp. ALD_RP9]|uniref:hypothetical protein n=1 Tax=Psychroflexus sp. ALD_RP9 TaxID=2777186 RepID=UPI001A8D7872|nr:hypothetical protein [Psychroflexus sp. ALD_RP9]QSS96907.1 hypothetical protein IMZ30_10720 [Psychroflexus sp. ALD_RP9]
MKPKKQDWTIARTLLFAIVGAMNTFFIKPEDIGTWKNYFGYLFLLIAVIHAIFIIKTYFTRNANTK